MSKDGGPAFPRSVWTNGFDQMKVEAFNNGMTLRDWFAGQTLICMLNGSGQGMLPQQAAAAAYHLADAMIAEREK